MIFLDIYSRSQQRRHLLKQTTFDEASYCQLQVATNVYLRMTS